MERNGWTDERMDDAITRIEQRFDRFEAHMERNFERMWAEFRDLKAEVRLDITDVRGETRTEITGVRGEIAALRGEQHASTRQLAHVGWALAGILLAQVIAAVVALALNA